MSEARKIKASTVSVSCNSDAEMNKLADVPISVVVGPEVVTGSTRLKSGTAQKLVLNMLSTASMIRLGKVYGDLMVNVQATNHKLRERVKNIVMEITHVKYEEAEQLVDAGNGDARLAIVMHERNVDLDQAKELLQRYDWRVRQAVEHNDEFPTCPDLGKSFS